MRKILFICPCATQECISKIKYQKKYYILPLGVLSIVSYCTKTTDPEETQFSILDFNTKKYEFITNQEVLEAVQAKIEEFQPDIIGISVLFDTLLETAGMISEAIKRLNKDILVICGGTATSLSYNEILNQNPAIDAICFSEGEIPISQLLKAESFSIELEQNKSFITRKNLEDPTFEPEAVYIYDLDEIPPLPYHMLDMGGYENSYNNEDVKKAFVMHTARGCPFRCKFCTAPKLFGHKLRMLSAERVLSDVAFVKRVYGIEKLSIFDEQLLAKKERAKQILNGIIELGLQLEMDNGVNIALLDDEVIHILLKADIKRFVLSIESGSQYVLNNIMNKPVQLDKVNEILPKLCAGKFYITSNFVIGMPGETEAHRWETKNFILNSELDWSVIYVAMPFKGSQLYDECKAKQYLVTDEDGMLRVETKDIHYKELEQEAYLMNLECNFVKNRAMRVGDYQKGKLLMARVRDKYSFHAFAHYYYAQCCLQLKEKLEYDVAMKDYFRTINESKEWKHYAQRFRLPLEPSRSQINVVKEIL